MKSHPETYFEALELALSDKEPYSWRAAWMIRSCSKKMTQDFRTM